MLISLFIHVHQEFVSEEQVSDIISRQQQIKEQDQHLCEVKERLREYEQRMEECHKNLMALKDRLQFNEKLTRLLLRENQILQLKLQHKGHLLASSSNSGRSEDDQKTKEEQRKELDTLQDKQETYEIRYESYISIIITLHSPHIHTG